MSTDEATARCARRHLRLGWWLLFTFLSLGIVLEVMHGFRIRWYLDVSNETRRLMWRLAHAHGSLLALIHLAFSAGVLLFSSGDPGWRRRASGLLTWSSILLPGGFFLGGLIVHGSDPWVGVLFVPVGAFLLLASVVITARGLGSSGP